MGEEEKVRLLPEDRRTKQRPKPAAKKLTYNCRRVKGAGVLFVLLWNLLVFSYQMSALGNIVDMVLARNKQGDDAEEEDEDPWIRSVVAAVLSDCLPKMLYPLAGWLADGKLGRYKVMRYSLWLMWVGSVLLILTSILRYTLAMEMPAEKGNIIKFTLPAYAVIYLINVMGIAGYHVNVIPFGIDQMEGASGEEISSLVHWYYWTRNFNFGMLVQFALQMIWKSCENNAQGEYHQRLDLYTLLIQMVFLTAAVCLDLTFSNKLHKDAKIHDSVKKVKDVSFFVLRHSQPVGHRKAHTFTYEAPPTRSDFAKESYGGPFKDDEVEEVISFWRIIVILLAWGFGVFMIQSGYYNYPSFYEHMTVPSTSGCTEEYLVTNFISILTFTLSIPFFEFFLYPFLRNYIPRTTVRMGVGMFVVLFGLSCMLAMDAVAHSFTEDGVQICMFYGQKKNVSVNSLYLVPVIVVMAIGEMLVFISTLEFICAQAPYSMRGMMIGISFMIYGLSIGVVSVVLAVFSEGMKKKYESETKGPSCGTWYIMTILIIGCVGTILYIIAAKQYRKRQRGGQKDVNQQTVVEGYYERSVKYNRPMNMYYRN